MPTPKLHLIVRQNPHQHKTSKQQLKKPCICPLEVGCLVSDFKGDLEVVRSTPVMDTPPPLLIYQKNKKALNLVSPGIMNPKPNDLLDLATPPESWTLLATGRRSTIFLLYRALIRLAHLLDITLGGSRERDS